MPIRTGGLNRHSIAKNILERSLEKKDVTFMRKKSYAELEIRTNLERRSPYESEVFNRSSASKRGLVRTLAERIRSELTGSCMADRVPFFRHCVLFVCAYAHQV